VDVTDDAVLAEIERWRAETAGSPTETLTAMALASRLSQTPGDYQPGPAITEETVGVSRAIGRLVLAGSLDGADVTLMNQSWVVLR
jgi:hypothetical protein